MDPLDDVLDGVRVRRSMVGQSMATPPWALSVDSRDPLVLVGMLTGSGWLRRADDEPVAMPQGAIAIIVGGRPVIVADDPATRPGVVITGAEACFDPLSGKSLVDSDRTAARRWGDPDAPTSVLIAGYRAEGRRFATLASDLPELIIVSDDPVARHALAAVAAETIGDQPGQQVVFDRLMELMLFATVRAWVSTAEHAPSWYRAISDPFIGPSLRAIHHDPARRWTVADLAALAAQSRSGFARRFRELVGESPVSYLTSWRLAWAADLLAGGAPVEQVAHTVGYTDPFAFSTAFRRQHGVTPSHHRRNSRTNSSTGHATRSGI